MGFTGANEYSYIEDGLKDLETALSSARFATYSHAAGGDREAAMRLYAWNAAISAAFYVPLQALEITLRNAMDTRLIAAYGTAWCDRAETGLDDRAVRAVAQAKSRLSRNGNAARHPHVVAALSFGFWVSLLEAGSRQHASRHSADYERTLWRPALRAAFPHAVVLTRRQAHTVLNSLRLLRNRIAHHEPVFQRNLSEDHENILMVIGWISPRKQEWVRAHSHMDGLLAMRP